MKSQDIVLLLKLFCLELHASIPGDGAFRAHLGIPDDWHGWSAQHEEPPPSDTHEPDPWSVRSLQDATGISKSQVSDSLRRSVSVGLAHADRRSGRLLANRRALHGFILHGLKFVFPATRGALVRGIPTTHAAPVLAGKLLSAGEHIDVWEDGYGTALGQRVEPLHHAVPHAVRRDASLYALLALVDAIRLGRERESAFAGGLLGQMLDVSP